MRYICFLVTCIACVATVGAADLSDLMVKEPVNPDDVMLRRPAGRTRAELDARAKAAAAAAEAKAKEEAEAKARAEAAAAEAKAKEEKAKVEAELKALREQVAREKAAREEIEGKAAMDRAAAEKAAAQAVSDRAAAEKAAAQAAADRAAAEKATEAKAKAEKRIEYLQNPDPDERPKPRKLEAPAEQRDVTETVPATEKKKAKKAKGEKGAAARTGRDAVITSERTDYDRKEGVILFDRNVYVDDEQYQMHADRLFVFLDGTNDLKRIVAIGHVSITNEQRTASCSRAVFTKAASKIVMYGDETSNAKLMDPSQRGGMAEGKKITFWLDAEQVSVEESAVRLPGGALKARDPKKLMEKAK